MIRQLIREILLQEATLADFVPTRHRPQEVSRDYSNGGGLKYGDDVTTKYRRGIKKDWNKHADMSFFQNPKKLQVIHFLGLYSGNNSLADYFPPGNFVPGKIPGIHIPNRNELSCIGLVPPVNNPEDHSFDYSSKRFFTFKRYRVTLVVSDDAGTERLSNATPEDVNKMKGSGLAKRPASSTSHYSLPVDEKEMGRLSFRWGGSGSAPGEVVIDNWIIDTFYCDNEMVEQAKALGLKYKVIGSKISGFFDDKSKVLPPPPPPPPPRLPPPPPPPGSGKDAMDAWKAKYGPKTLSELRALRQLIKRRL